MCDIARDVCASGERNWCITVAAQNDLPGIETKVEKSGSMVSKLFLHQSQVENSRDSDEVSEQASPEDRIREFKLVKMTK